MTVAFRRSESAATIILRILQSAGGLLSSRAKCQSGSDRGISQFILARVVRLAGTNRKDSGHRRHCRSSRLTPEFVFVRPGRGKGGLLARVGTIPFFRSNLLRGVGRIFSKLFCQSIFPFATAPAVWVTEKRAIRTRRSPSLRLLR
jgi:hypothetical protein